MTLICMSKNEDTSRWLNNNILSRILNKVGSQSSPSFSETQKKALSAAFLEKQTQKNALSAAFLEKQSIIVRNDTDKSVKSYARKTEQFAEIAGQIIPSATQDTLITPVMT